MEEQWHTESSRGGRLEWRRRGRRGMGGAWGDPARSGGGASRCAGVRRGDSRLGKLLRPLFSGDVAEEDDDSGEVLVAH